MAVNKVEINKEVVLFRKAVKQAKIHIIHKLSRQIKLLRAKNGTEEQKVKFNQKADKYASEILAIKKFKDHNISLYALSTNRNAKMVVQNPNSETEQALNKLISYKTISSRIDDFRSKYQVSIDEIFKPNYKSKNRKRQKRNRKLKAENSLISAQNEANDSNQDEDNEEVQNSDNEEIHDEDNEEIHDEDNEELTDEDIEELQDKNMDTVEDEAENSQSDTKLKIRNTKKSDRIKENTKNDKQIEKNNKSGKREAKPTAKNQRTKFIKEFNSLLTKGNDKQEAGEAKVVDSFFCCLDDKEYLTYAPAVAVEDDVDNKMKNDRFETDNKQKRKGFNKTDNFINTKRKRNTELSDAFNRKDRRRNLNAKFNKTDNAGNYSEKNSLEKDNSDKQNLHPSWQAKLQQKPVITAFQGKKIKFDDD